MGGRFLFVVFIVSICFFAWSCYIAPKGGIEMTKTERAMKWLRDEYGITSEEELDRALERTKLDIGIFISPLPIAPPDTDPPL